MASEGAKKALGGGGLTCAACNDRVYPLDKQMVASGSTYHHKCFKCSHCKSQLTIANWSIGNGSIFCKTHYIELFKSSGGKYNFGGSSPTVGGGESGPSTPTEAAAAASTPVVAAPAPAPEPEAEVAAPAPASAPWLNELGTGDDIDVDAISSRARGMSVKDRIKASEEARKSKELSDVAAAAAATPKGTSTTVAFGAGAAPAASCSGCGKSIFSMDVKVAVSGGSYHMACFKCSHCKSQLSLVNYAELESKPYCKAHFHELFMAKGNYDFGSAKATDADAGATEADAPPATSPAAADAPAVSPQEQAELLDSL